MSGEKKQPQPYPKNERWIWLPRELVVSSVWRCLGINTRRFIDFLIIEHLNHGGARNGFLLAPRRQLAAFGIGTHFISEAVNQAIRVGLVDCKPGIGRRPSTYGLTWQWSADGSPPTNRWRSYQAVASAQQHLQEMSAVSTFDECQTALTRAVTSAKQHSQGRKSSSAKQHPLLKDPYQDGAASQKVGGTIVPLLDRPRIARNPR